MPDLHPVVLHHVVNTLGWPALRPLQEAAVGPLLRGDDALLLAPTAGGKTEAAIFPLLTRAANEQWRGLSVVYVCPLRALLNNLAPRLESYAAWLGLRARVWHGDTREGERRRLRADPPEILLTTPESLEAMLVSTKLTAREHFANVRAVVIDEVHAFAGDDRGWHLLAVLERLERLAGRPIQRVGLSATVGNPTELLDWLQGSARGSRPASVIAPDLAASEPKPVAGQRLTASEPKPVAGQRLAASELETVAGQPGPPAGEVTLDDVGSLAGAAKVISLLHAGEKRLVFCESRREVEELARLLVERQVTTFVSHSSLASDERRRAEEAFAQARDCVIVSTSTLELGIDVGDLDRVIQINAPGSVAAFLQRLGRTGRRTGTTRNALFLATSDEGLMRAAGLLLLWGRGFVEPVVPPPSPRHIAAQQVLALCLQEGRVGDAVWRQWWGDLPLFDEHTDRIVDWLIDTGHLARESGMLFIGPAAELAYGRRNFMELVSVFTAAPQFTVLHGRAELGTIDPIVLTRSSEGPRVIVLAARAWQVTHIDWQRRRCHVEPTDQSARMRWVGGAASVRFEMVRAQRDVLLGADPAVVLSRRAREGLARARQTWGGAVSPAGLVLSREDDDVYWWTWAGDRANATLIAGLPGIADPVQRVDAARVRLLGAEAVPRLGPALSGVEWGTVRPAVSPHALEGLKFSDVLPRDLAVATIAERLADPAGAAATAAEPRVHVRA